MGIEKSGSRKVSQVRKHIRSASLVPRTLSSFVLAVMKFPYLLLLFVAPLTSSGQVKKIRSFEINEPVASASIDRAGDFYVLTTSGQIQKFDADGTLKAVHKTNPPPTLFDPRDGARMFAYYRDDHSYAYISPSFDITASYLIDSAFVADPWLACASGDFNIWALDSLDRSLKKINPKKGMVEVDVKLNDSINIAAITTLREYQGFLFMLCKGSGMMIFNGMGKHIRSINNKAITGFNFLGEELYYVTAGKLRFLDIFSAETRDMDLPEISTFALLTDQRVILITGNTIKLFEFKP